MVNQEIVVGRRRRAQDCPPYLAWPFSRVSRLSRFPLLGFPDLQNPKPGPGSAPIKAKNPLIVHDQGTSRHPQKTPVSSDACCLKLLWSLDVGIGCFPPRAFAPKTSHQVTIKPQSRQKPQQSRLIVPHQGIGSKMNAPLMSTPTLPATRDHWMLGVRCWLLDVFPFPDHQASSRQTL